MSQISCKDLILGYEKKAVTAPLTFQVDEGDYLYILGDNGSGKSTLVKTLLGLCKPIGGEMLLGDGLHQNEIGYMPQQTVVQRDFPACVEEIVLSGCLNRMGIRPFYGQGERKLAAQMLDKMEITQLRKKSYRELSGGQQQRVLLARALCATRKMLLLDEPVAGLDPVVSKELYEVIEQLNKEQKITIVMVTHDIAAAVVHASHILHVSEQPLFFGTAKDYRKTEVGNYYLSITGGCTHDD